MAVSRPLILALLAAILCAISFYAAMGAQRTSGVSSAAPPAAPQAGVGEPAAPERPQPAQPARERDRAADGERGTTGEREGRDRGEGARERPGRGERERGGRGNRAEPNRPDRSRRTNATPLPPELRVEGLPRPVARALADKRTIVLFFRQGGADDALVADAVNSVRDMRGVAVFSAPIERIGRYRAVIGGLGLARAPAVAIVDGKRRARVVEGFVDAGTLRQLVMDAR